MAILYKVDDFNPAEHYDMLSYTCNWRNGLNPGLGNVKNLCYQMRYAWWGALVVAILEIAALVTLMWGWRAVRSTRKGAHNRVGEGNATYDGGGKQRENLQLSAYESLRPYSGRPAPDSDAVVNDGVE